MKSKIRSIIVIVPSQFPRSNRLSLEYTIVELPRHFLGTEIVLRTYASGCTEYLFVSRLHSMVISTGFLKDVELCTAGIFKLALHDLLVRVPQTDCCY